MALASQPQSIIPGLEEEQTDRDSMTPNPTAESVDLGISTSLLYPIGFDGIHSDTKITG